MVACLKRRIYFPAQHSVASPSLTNGTASEWTDMRAREEMRVKDGMRAREDIREREGMRASQGMRVREVTRKT